MAGSNHCNTEDTVHNVVDVMPCDNVPGSDHDNTENEVRSVANEVLGAVDQAVDAVAGVVVPGGAHDNTQDEVCDIADQAVDAVAGVVVTGCAHDNTQDEVCDVADQAVDVVADDGVPGSAHDNIENEVRNVANEVLGAVDEAVDVVADDVLPGSIFCSDFNLGFGSPRSDTCGRCETLLGDTLNRHKQSADEAYKQLKIDRELAKEGSCIFMTYDMEKTMPLPKLSVGEAFYLRQIWLYNVGVHVVSQKREGTYFQIWTEVSSSSGPEA